MRWTTTSGSFLSRLGSTLLKNRNKYIGAATDNRPKAAGGAPIANMAAPNAGAKKIILLYFVFIGIDYFF